MDEVYGRCEGEGVVYLMASVLVVDKCYNCGGKLTVNKECTLIECLKCGWGISIFTYEWLYANPNIRRSAPPRSKQPQHLNRT